MNKNATKLLMGVALGLSGCTNFVAQDNFASYEKTLPVPKPFQGEPEITVVSNSVTNRKHYTQKFSDAGTFETQLLEVPIAALYYAFAKREYDLAATLLPVTCTLEPGGIVRVQGCTAQNGLSDDQYLSMRLVRSWGEGINLPRFSARPEAERALTRTVSLTLAVPAIPAPKTDFGAGPLIDRSQIDLPSPSRAYPSRALRREAEGDMTVECQVQADLSLICRQMSFTPQEHADLFRNAEKRLFRSTVKAGPFLKDETSARGVRFQFKVRWRLAE